MVKFQSPEVIINRTDEDFFNKIGDLNNLKEIMPSSIMEFQSTSSTCSFRMKGMPSISLTIQEKIPFSRISLTTKESEIPFSLDCFITNRENQCQVRLEINAEMNIMMKMMVEKPLTQFLDILSSKMGTF